MASRNVTVVLDIDAGPVMDSLEALAATTRAVQRRREFQCANILVRKLGPEGPVSVAHFVDAAVRENV